MAKTTPKQAAAAVSTAVATSVNPNSTFLPQLDKSQHTTFAKTQNTHHRAPKVDTKADDDEVRAYTMRSNELTLERRARQADLAAQEKAAMLASANKTASAAADVPETVSTDEELEKKTHDIIQNKALSSGDMLESLAKLCADYILRREATDRVSCLDWKKLDSLLALCGMNAQNVLPTRDSIKLKAGEAHLRLAEFLRSNLPTPIQRIVLSIFVIVGMQSSGKSALLCGLLGLLVTLSCADTATRAATIIQQLYGAEAAAAGDVVAYFQPKAKEEQSTRFVGVEAVQQAVQHHMAQIKASAPKDQPGLSKDPCMITLLRKEIGCMPLVMFDLVGLTGDDASRDKTNGPGFKKASDELTREVIRTQVMLQDSSTLMVVANVNLEPGLGSIATVVDSVQRQGSLLVLTHCDGKIAEIRTLIKDNHHIRSDEVLFHMFRGRWEKIFGGDRAKLQVHLICNKVSREPIKTKEEHARRTEELLAEVEELHGSWIVEFKEIIAEYRAPYLAKITDPALLKQADAIFHQKLKIGFPELKRYMAEVYTLAAERELLFTQRLLHHLRAGAHATSTDLLNLPLREAAGMRLNEPFTFVQSVLESADYIFRCVLTGEYEGEIPSTKHIPKPSARTFQDIMLDSAAVMMVDESVGGRPWPRDIPKDERDEYMAMYKQDTGRLSSLGLRLHNALKRLLSTLSCVPFPPLLQHELEAARTATSASWGVSSEKFVSDKYEQFITDTVEAATDRYYRIAMRILRCGVDITLRMLDAVPEYKDRISHTLDEDLEKYLLVSRAKSIADQIRTVMIESGKHIASQRGSVHVHLLAACCFAGPGGSYRRSYVDVYRLDIHAYMDRRVTTGRPLPLSTNILERHFVEILTELNKIERAHNTGTTFQDTAEWRDKWDSNQSRAGRLLMSRTLFMALSYHKQQDELPHMAIGVDAVEVQHQTEHFQRSCKCGVLALILNWHQMLPTMFTRVVNVGMMSVNDFASFIRSPMSESSGSAAAAHQAAFTLDQLFGGANAYLNHDDAMLRAENASKLFGAGAKSTVTTAGAVSKYDTAPASTPDGDTRAFVTARYPICSQAMLVRDQLSRAMRMGQYAHTALQWLRRVQLSS